ncbi:MAG: peptidylprolyl isomerase [Acidobacteriia bacterium]|nr:peptidylprolyl isomerase [Terriglobia bacterium]
MIRFLQSGNKAVKYVLSAFLLIICVSMLWYLIPSSGTALDTNQQGVVASVAGEDIRTADVNDLVQQQMRQQQGRIPDFYIPILRQQAVMQLIQRAEVRYEAERLGLKVSDQEVQDELQNGMSKAYFFPDGKFIGKQKYEELLKLNGKTPETFENDVRQQLMVSKLISAVGASANASDAEVEQAYKDRNLKVKFQYAVLNLDDLTKQIKPTPSEVEAFFAANKAGYQSAIPEKRQVRYFVINDKDVESKITVDAAELQRYHLSHQDEYRVPERVRVRHILISTPPASPDGKVDQKAVDEARVKAEGILKQIKAGGDFAELAKKNSQDSSAADGGELGWIVKGQTVAEFEKVAFAQNKGQISDLVKTIWGFHIIQTEEKQDAHVKPLAEVQATIEPVLKAQKTSAALEAKAKEAEDTATKQGLDKAAAKYGAPVVQSNLITRNDALPGVGASPQLMQQVFSTKEKSPPQTARVATGYVFFELQKVEPARAPALEEVRDKVTKDFVSSRSAELLRKKGQELANRAHAENDLAKAAKEVGATFKTSELVDRNAQVADIGALSGPAAVAFTMKRGDISGALNLGTREAVIAITDRQEPSAADPQFAKDRDQLREQIVQQRQEQAWRLFLEALGARMEKEGKVKINQAEMNGLTRTRG